MDISQADMSEHRKRLKDFIKNPCTQTLYAFANTLVDNDCILGRPEWLRRPGWVRHNSQWINSEEEGTSRMCPPKCSQLAEARRKQFKAYYSGCKRSTLKMAWHTHPSELLLSLIEFDAYLDSEENKYAVWHSQRKPQGK
jgi:hypothetical protein